MKLFITAAMALMFVVSPITSKVAASNTKMCCGCCSGDVCACAQCTCCDCSQCPTCAK